MKLKAWTYGIIGCLFWYGLASADNSATYSKKNIEQIVHNYLVEHPEVLMEASKALQKKQQQNMQEQAKVAISKNVAELFTDPFTVTGNKSANIVLVEFFDYQCVHCKKMGPILEELVKNNSNLKVVYKEFPIFGKESEFASKIALAAALQGKYQSMHTALLKEDKRFNEKLILNTAKSLGFNIANLQNDMKNDAIEKSLAANRKLAEELHLMGTPALVIAVLENGELKQGSTPMFIPGGASEETLQDLIKEISVHSTK